MAEFPNDWGAKRLKFVARHIIEKRQSNSSDVKISPENVESETGRVLDYFSEYDGEGHEFQAGDILFNKLRVYLNKVVLTDRPGLSMGEMIVVRPYEIEATYLVKVMRSNNFIESVDSLSEGVKLPRPPIDGIMNRLIPIPPLEEQALISRYLDKKTAQIDSLIQKIEKKIELLKEQRTSLINQCVTKGLDPNVEMKDSGVEWIGKIPKHWKISKYKYEITIQNGYPFKSELFDNENGYPLIRIRDVTSGSIETFYTGEPLPEFTVKNGDLLIGMDGDFNVRWWMGPDALLNQRVCRVFNGERLDRRYVSYTLPFQLKVINDLTYFTTVKHLSSFDVLEARTLVPPISEQTEIVNFLNKKTKQLDRVIVFESERVLLLSEFRQSLISSVVTGKIRVTEDMV